MTNQKHYPDLGSDASSVWNFCTHFSDVIWQGNQWQRRQMQAVFSGYCLFNQLVSLSLTFPVQDSIEQPTCWDATKQHLRKECRNSILLTCHYPDLGCNSLCLRQITTWHNQSETQPRSQAIGHQYEIFIFVVWTLFYGETSGGIPKFCRFFQAVVLFNTTSVNL